jgi:hypothetical protein
MPDITKPLGQIAEAARRQFLADGYTAAEARELAELIEAGGDRERVRDVANVCRVTGAHVTAAMFARGTATVDQVCAHLRAHLDRRTLRVRPDAAVPLKLAAMAHEFSRGRA